MTRDVITVAPNDALLNVARLFGVRKIGVLPVLDGGKLVGIVSYIDLLNRYVIPMMEADTNASDNGAALAKETAADASAAPTRCEQIALF